MKILLVEDEASLATMMHKGLTEKGYNVTVVADGNIAFKMAMENEFSLFILDIMLPGLDGLGLCRQLRKNKINAPVLILTALGTTENIVAGLDSGADDYLLKPFRFAELEARLRSLLRRTKLAEDLDLPEKLAIDDLEMNMDAKTVKRGAVVINLTATEFRLLECLIRNKNKVLSRLELLEKVWGVGFNMATNVVDVYVNYLRKKIDKDFDVKLIHTVVGMGYTIKSEQ
ncbi:response regulator transcription factor [Chitinophagaceae bacterium LWZ2-11]